MIIRNGITSREAEILSLVAIGYTNKEIAENLKITNETVKKHLKNIYKKLNAHNKIEALRMTGYL